MARTTEEHVAAVEAWIQEAKDDQGLEGDEVAFDIISSYIACEIDGGEGSAEARALRVSLLGEA